MSGVQHMINEGCRQSNCCCCRAGQRIAYFRRAKDSTFKREIKPNFIWAAIFCSKLEKKVIHTTLKQRRRKDPNKDKHLKENYRVNDEHLTVYVNTKLKSIRLLLASSQYMHQSVTNRNLSVQPFLPAHSLLKQLVVKLNRFAIQIST